MARTATGKKKIKPFRDWLEEEVAEAFGLTRLSQHALLTALETTPLQPDAVTRAMLEKYRNEAFQLIEAWNEDEYKFMFISPFLKLVDFWEKDFKPFTQRLMQVTYNNGQTQSSGLVEWMLAKGRQIPKKPYFFLHEYKPEKNRDNDPLGQLLIAMVAAQQQNQDEKPVYGVYVNGRNWFLVVLSGHEYAASNAYNITDEDIFSLFAVLMQIKQVMEELYR